MNKPTDYPAHAKVGRVVPKTRIHAAGRASRTLQDKMAQQVARIVWQYKLAPETLNLPASRAVPEIQVFQLVLKSAGMGDDLPTDILRCIDRAIAFPLIFELVASTEEGAARDQVRMAAAYKRPSQADAAQWVVGDYFATPWHAADKPRTALPVALDMARLYENMLRQIIPLAARNEESIAALAERHRQLTAKQREHLRLEARLHRERQFNRKVEINAALRELNQEIRMLNGAGDVSDQQERR